MKKLLLTIIFVLILAGQGWATTYYLNCGCAGTGGDGTTTNCGDGGTNAFVNISQVEAGIPSGANGHDLYSKEGSANKCIIDTNSGIWSDRFNIEFGGTSGDTSIIGCYKTVAGDCADGTEWAWFDGNKSTWSTGCTSDQCVGCMRFYEGYVQIENLRVENCAGNGILFYEDDDGATDILIQYNYVNNIGKTGINEYDAWDVYDCELQDQNQNTNVTIRQNHVQATGLCNRGYEIGACGDACAECQGWPQGISTGGSNILVEYNYIVNIFGEGVHAISEAGASGNTIVQMNHIEGTGAAAIGFYRGSANIARYNMIIGYKDGSGYQNAYSDCNSEETSRNWNRGIFINNHFDENVTSEIYGNIVIGAREGIAWDYANCADTSEASTTYVYNNIFIDNCANYQVAKGTNHTIVGKNNISYCYQPRCQEVRESVQTSSITMDYNLWKVAPSGGNSDWGGANDEIGNPYVPDIDGTPAGSAAHWQDIDARNEYTTEDTFLASNSNAISEGVDLGSTASCADDDNLDDNCGLKMDSTFTDFHDLPATITFGWCDQEDPPDIGPWTYTCDDPGLPTNKGGLFGG